MVDVTIEIDDIIKKINLCSGRKNGLTLPKMQMLEKEKRPFIDPLKNNLESIINFYRICDCFKSLKYNICK